VQPDTDDLGDLADAVLEGRPLDWQELESSAGAESRDLISQFRTIARIADLRRRVANDPPEWWGHLKIQERLGAGAFGEVFRAWDSRLEREVALKLLRSDRDPAAVLREARLLARIRHANVVTVFDAAEFEGRAGFWMEFIQGQTLEEGVHDRGPLPAPEVLKLAIELCGALAAVHAAGLLHRDIKAQNVVRTADGRVVLMDFGAGDELASVEPVSQQAVGTPLYLAPEVLSGGAATPLSEVYSLGVLLYRVATGSYPISGTTIDELRGTHTQGVRKKFLDVRPEFPRDLARLIDRALEPDPSRRMQNAREMAGALERLQRRMRGRRMARMALAASLPLVLAFLVLFQSTRTGRQEEVARHDAEVSEAAVSTSPKVAVIPPPDLAAANASPEPSKNRLSIWRVFSGPEAVNAISPDGSLITFSDRTTRGLVVRNLVSGRNRELTHTTGFARESIISPNGKEVALIWIVPGVETQVQIAPLIAGADPRVIHRDPSITLKDWSPDGRSLLVTLNKDGGAYIATLSVEDGSVRMLKSTGRTQVVRAKFSPDGKYIVHDTGPPTAAASDIFIVSADGSQDSAVVQHPANDNSPIWSPDSSRILYVSHRTSTPSLWSVPIKDGYLDGVEELVRSDVGAITPVTMTRAGILYYSVRGRSRRNIYRVGLGEDGKVSETPKVVTDRFVNANWGASVSIDGKYLAYYSNRPDAVLVIRDLSNAKERWYPLTMEVNTIYFDGPGWLPDAHSVLLAGRDNPAQPEALYRIDLDTGNAEILSRYAFFEFEVTPDGKSVFTQGAPRSVLTRINLQDGVTTRIRRISFSGGPFTLKPLSPTVSPDGTRIAYIYDSEIVVSSLPGDEPRVVFKYPEGTGGGNAVGNTLAWTSNQDHILFTLEEQSRRSIWRVPSNGGIPEQLGVSTYGEIKGPTMHPDGRTLFFTVLEDAINEIWAIQHFLPTPAR
jgi:serine/threonine-protein kinase